VVPGNAHESPVLYQLVEDFVAAVGPGVLKWLILDRGFINGPKISHCKTDLGINVLIPMKKRMNIWEDAWALAAQQPWQLVPAVLAPPPPSVPGRPDSIQRAENKRQQTLAQKKAQQAPPPPDQVLERTEVCVVNDLNSWSEASVPIHAVLSRDIFADGHQHQWALMSTEKIVDALAPRSRYQWRTQIEERHRLLKCFHDLSDFHSRDFNVIVAQVVFVLLTYTLRQWQIWKLRQEQQLAGLTPQNQSRRLSIRQQYVVIYHEQAYTQMPLVSFTREVLQLQGQARDKALAKILELEQSLLTPLENLRPP